MTTVNQYLRESDNVALETLDDSGNLTILGGLSSTGGVASQTAAAGVAGGSSVAVTGPLTQEFSLTSVNLLALRATPMQLVPAPGAGKYVRVTSYVLIYTFVTGAYTNTNATMKLFQGTTANAAALTADLGAILLNTASRQENGASPADLTDTIAHMQNTGIFLGNDGSAEFLTGAGTLKVLLTYQIVTP